MKKFFKKILQKFGWELKRIVNTRPNPIHLWDEDENFGRIFSEILPYTLVDKGRCFMLYQLLKQTASIPGEVAEVGVYRGGTAKLLGMTGIRGGISKEILLFDTFSGMPDTDPEKDLHKKGDFSDVTLNQVKNLLSDIPKVKIYPGFFPESAKTMVAKDFSFVHVDVDIYQSVFDCCEFFYPRLQKGGIMVFDDYGFLSCPGAKIAVDKFFSHTPEKPIYLPTGQVTVIKL